MILKYTKHCIMTKLMNGLHLKHARNVRIKISFQTIIIVIILASCAIRRKGFKSLDDLYCGNII